MPKWILISLLYLSSCDYYLINAHKHHVSHIDIKPDDNFQVCFKEALFPCYNNWNKINSIHGRDSLNQHFLKYFDSNGHSNESGYVTLRFIINCKGEIGAIRVLETTTEYEEKSFHPSISQNLISLLQGLGKWKAFGSGDSNFDCSTHLSFKIINGELVEILP